MAIRSMSKALLMILVMGMGKVQADQLNPWDVGIRVLSGAGGAVVCIWAWNRMKDCWADIQAKTDGKDRKVPTFGEDVTNVVLTTGCAMALAGVSLGANKDTLNALGAIAVEGGIMGSLFLGGKYIGRLKEMRLRHAMGLAITAGLLRQGAQKADLPHFKFKIPETTGL